MFGEHFYHKQIRNTVIEPFNTIFNNVNIVRTDSSKSYTNASCSFIICTKRKVFKQD